MKLLKIGSSPSCNIVINSPYVSGVHAEMTLMDNGEIFIEDKNSTNGTFVNNQRLTPNVETQLRRGDLVMFGNVQLQWHQVPVLENPSKYKTIINIGTSHRCDINLDSQFASRYHATVFVDNKGKCFIQDNDSKNGTEVNGSKIAKNKRVPLKSGDQVVVADVDVTDQLKPYVPNPWGWLKKAAIGIAAAAVLAGVAIGAKPLIEKLIGNDPTPPLAEIQKSVVVVYGTYSVYIELDNNPISDEIWNTYINSTPGRLKLTSRAYTGTAFFLDREGRLGTNRHVAVPWEYVDENERKGWNSEAEQLLNNQLKFGEVNSDAVIEAYQTLASEGKSALWPAVLNQTKSENKGISYLNSLIRQLRNSKFKIVGELDYFGIAYPGRMYTNVDEFARCSMVDYSESKDIDLALIRLNDRHTPDNITWVFDPAMFDTGKIEIQKDKLTWIGYPNGLAWAMDLKTQELRPQVRETMCSSTPSKFYFDIQGEIVSGASGSPVFNSKTGVLEGVAFASRVGGSTYGCAIHAKYLKEMYEKETK